MPKAPSVKWTREHRLIALNLYCKLPFGKLHNRNPIIREVAAKMGRTDSSLAMKLTNFASFDPVLQARGISGMRGATKQDRIDWDEFQANLSTLGPLSEQLLHDLITSDQETEVDLLDPRKVAFEKKTVNPPAGETEIVTTVKVRRGQNFFRQTVLNAYGVRCAISGIGVPRLLVASHIKPWCDFPSERLNPRNGLCLSTIHDSAFDAGLITVDADWRIVVSKKLRDHFSEPTLSANFEPFEGQRIRMPEQLAEPSQEFLEHHRCKIFCG